MKKPSKNDDDLSKMKPLYLMQHRPHGHRTWRAAVYSTASLMKQVLDQMEKSEGGPAEYKIKQLERLTGEWTPISSIENLTD